MKLINDVQSAQEVHPIFYMFATHTVLVLGIIFVLAILVLTMYNVLDNKILATFFYGIIGITVFTTILSIYAIINYQPQVIYEGTGKVEQISNSDDRLNQKVSLTIDNITRDFMIPSDQIKNVHENDIVNVKLDTAYDDKFMKDNQDYKEFSKSKPSKQLDFDHIQNIENDLYLTKK